MWFNGKCQEMYYLTVIEYGQKLKVMQVQQKENTNHPETS